jgi:type IV secretory pathway VirD2 relaxase
VRESDGDLRVRPGRIRDRRAPRQKSFIKRVLRAANKAGHVSSDAGKGWRSRAFGRSTFGRGRIGFSRNRLFNPARRVVVKARVVRHRGKAFRSAPLATHLTYLKRDGVTRNGQNAMMFDAANDQVDGAEFAQRSKEDRHHFRFIIGPEDAAEMTDLKAFTRDLARQMEADLGTTLDWTAVDHWNTDNPHIHLLVRGIDDQGADLVISRDYIGHGLRSRAEELVSIELGPKTELEIRRGLEKEITAGRWTRLDTEIRIAADETGYIDLRPEQPGAFDPQTRRLMVGRLQHLEKMGLATSVASGEWIVALEAERHLRDLAIRSDIIKTMHRAFTSRGEERGVADYVIDNDMFGSPIVGRLIDRGIHDELTGEAYAIIDGTDGRAHHVRFRGIEVLEHAPPVGGVVEVRRFGSVSEQRPTLALANRSDFDLKQQIAAEGLTWLDYRLVEREPIPLANGGFGGQVREALTARADHLVTEGLARQRGQRLILQRDLLDTLRRRELGTVAAKLTATTGLPHLEAAAGAHVTGTYRQRLVLASGRFAMIDSGLGFQLVPWSRELDSKLGQHITGTVKETGGIEWGFGRKRDLGL